VIIEATVEHLVQYEVSFLLHKFNHISHKYKKYLCKTLERVRKRERESETDLASDVVFLRTFHSNLHTY
jgi:hypothetical protein